MSSGKQVFPLDLPCWFDVSGTWLYAACRLGLRLLFWLLTQVSFRFESGYKSKSTIILKLLRRAFMCNTSATSTHTLFLTDCRALWKLSVQARRNYIYAAINHNAALWKLSVAARWLSMHMLLFAISWSILCWHLGTLRLLGWWFLYWFLLGVTGASKYLSIGGRCVCVWTFLA